MPPEQQNRLSLYDAEVLRAKAREYLRLAGYDEQAAADLWHLIERTDWPEEPKTP